MYHQWVIQRYSGNNMKWVIPWSKMEYFHGWFPYQPTSILFMVMLDSLEVVLQWCRLRRNESNFQSVNPIRRNLHEIWKFDWFLLSLHHCNTTSEESSLANNERKLVDTGFIMEVLHFGSEDDSFHDDSWTSPYYPLVVHKLMVFFLSS